MSVRLDDIVQATRDSLARRKRERPLAELENELAARAEGRPFQEALAHPGTSLIAEHKRRSPSAGAIREGSSVTEIVQAYERGGAAAISVLTEETHFGGSLDDLYEARQATQLPILRKDFSVDLYQLYEAKVAGADAVLLVVGSLRKDDLERLYGEAQALDLDAIGINNRNLEDFTVDIQVTVDLLAAIPTGKTVVSESGIRTRQEIEELERVGVDAVLIGETLMRAPDPEEAVRELTRPEEGE